MRRRGSAATLAQTRLYRKRAGELVAQLRAEIDVPERPSGSPAVVLLMGLPGTGKSYCARILAARLGAAHLATDHLRSRMFIAASYVDDENAAIFSLADALLDDLLRDGHRVVLDATHLTARSRAAATATARRRDVPLVLVHVVADEPEIVARLASRVVARAPGDRSDADVAVYERMRAAPFEPPVEGHLEVRNGPDLAAHLEHVALDLERRCDRAS